MFDWLKRNNKKPARLDSIGQPLHVNPNPGDNFAMLRHLQRIKTLKEAKRERGCVKARRQGLQHEIDRRVKQLSLSGLELNWHDDVALRRLIKQYGGE